MAEVSIGSPQGWLQGGRERPSAILLHRNRENGGNEKELEVEI